MDRGLSMPWAIICAAAMGCLTYIGYREYEHSRDRREAAEVIKGLGELAQSAAVATPSPSVDPRLVTEARARQANRGRGRAISGSERCLSGRVIVVNGSAYSDSGLSCAAGRVLP